MYLNAAFLALLSCYFELIIEEKLTGNTSTMEDGPQDNMQKSSTNDDMLARRLKNRERQRRYRERKRLQADTKKVQLASLPVEVPVMESELLQVNVAPQDSLLPVNVSPVELVNVTPQEYVNVGYGDCTVPASTVSEKAVTRVYSGRKWKNDARKACRVSINGLVSQPDFGEPSLADIEQSIVAGSHNISTVSAPENNGMPKTIPSRRNWKAEARNKKS